MMAILNIIQAAYPPALTSPTPPGHDLMYFSSASNETGLNVPDLKYGPTGHVTINRRADVGVLTPRLCWRLNR